MKIVVPVEQLDEDRLVNIERRIVAGAQIAPASRAPRRLLGFAAAAVATMAGGVIGWKLHREPAQLAAPAPAPAPVIAMTGSTLELGDASIGSDPGASFRIERAGRDIVVELAHGKVELAVTHDPTRSFVVRAGDTEIEDVGTKFSVDYDGASRVDVRVTEGQVRVKHHRKDEIVAAGSAWSSGTPAAAVASVIEMDAMDARHHAAAPAVDVASTASKHAGSAAMAQPHATAEVKPDDGHGDLRAAIRAAPLGPPIAIGGDFAKAALDAKDVATKSQVFYAWALSKGDSVAALSLLEPVLRKDAGVAYVPALWLRLRIVCLDKLDERCRTAAHDYDAASGPNAAIARRILTETQ